MELNEVKRPDEPWCGWCEDYGWYYLFDHSTDAIIGTRKCECRQIPWRIYKPVEPFWRTGWKMSDAEKSKRKIGEVPF